MQKNNQEVVIASNNQHKIVEIKSILGNYFANFYSLKEKNIDIEIEENGKTFFDNALIKAKTISKLTGLPALGDDTGLMVDALDGAPGVYSARFAGPEHDDDANNTLLLKKLDGVKNRTARFETVIVLYYPDDTYVTAKGVAEGEIAEKRCGTRGFGYDSLFYSYDLGKTFAEGSLEEKNSISHRGRALKQLKTILETDYEKK